MAEEIIRFGAGGVPYKSSIVPTPEPEAVEVEEEPKVTVEVIEKETLGDIPRGKKGKIK